MKLNPVLNQVLSKDHEYHLYNNGREVFHQLSSATPRSKSRITGKDHLVEHIRAHTGIDYLPLHPSQDGKASYYLSIQL